MNSIIVILPYFGRLPNYFRLWLSSCSYNETIDFLILTDDDVSRYKYSPNVRFVSTSFEEFRAKAQEAFDFPLEIVRPYKLCDLKPFYGRILKDYVDGYDFWGHCDCDLIFGNIRKFATEKILSACDKFLGHGHFSLYRTCSSSFDEVLSFTKVRGKYDFRKILSDSKNFAFDEYDHGGISYGYQYLRPDVFYSGYCIGYRIYDDVNSEITPFRDLVKDADKKGRSVIYKFDHGRLDRIIEENDQIRFEETLYIHMMKRAMSDNAVRVDEFLIIPNSFIPMVNDIDSNLVGKLARCSVDMRKLRSDARKFRAWLKLGTRIRTLSAGR